MTTTIIAISLAVIALFCIGATFVFFSAALSVHHPSIGEIVDRQEAEQQRWARILEPIVSAAVDRAVARAFGKAASSQQS